MNHPRECGCVYCEASKLETGHLKHDPPVRRPVERQLSEDFLEIESGLLNGWSELQVYSMRPAIHQRLHLLQSVVRTFLETMKEIDSGTATSVSWIDQKLDSCVHDVAFQFRTARLEGKS